MSEFAVVEAWLVELRRVIDLEGLGEVDIAALLKAVREVAHSVTHPAGPVATLAIGYALARAGDDDLGDLLDRVVALAHQWPGPDAEPGQAR